MSILQKKHFCYHVSNCAGQNLAFVLPSAGKEERAMCALRNNSAGVYDQNHICLMDGGGNNYAVAHET